MKYAIAGGLLAFFLSGCQGYPETVRPVNDFVLKKYLGKWYEIARLDHAFERGLSQVTAEYSMREDGGVRVKNRGYAAKKGEWREASGKAFFVRNSDEGYLKVSFFGPFYGSYVIFDLDKENYQWAYVSGKKTNYLWFLSRTPTVSDARKKAFEKKVAELGFPANELIWVAQTP